MTVRRVRIIGPGRAGGAFALALERVGWSVTTLDRSADVTGAAEDTDMVLLCVPDGSIAEVASTIAADPDVVLAHCAGSRGLDVLAGHARTGSIHPLVALTGADSGSAMLRGAWFAVAGDPLMAEIVNDLGGQAIDVPDDLRVVHHAAAVIASNHLVALMGQVERIAALAGVPLEAYLDLVRGTVDNVADLGPAGALTGPVARGDTETVARHVEALPDSERAGYLAMVELAGRLVSERTDRSDDR